MARDVAVSFDDIDDKLAARQKKREEKEKEGKPVRDLVITKTPDGLYIAGYEGGGLAPQVVKGKWTSKARLEAVINRYYLEKGRLPVEG